MEASYGRYLCGAFRAVCETVLDAIKTAKKYGTIVSCGLNYCLSMWNAIEGQEKAQEVDKEIAKYVEL